MGPPVPSNQSVEDKISTLLSEILRGEALEEGFANLTSNTAEHEKIKRDYNIDLCKQIWISLSQEFHDAALKLYVHAVYKQQNGSRTKLLLDLLERMVANSILSPKLICTALLNDESLDYKQEEKWCLTFKFVRTIIGGVDYKGCRDLLRVLLEKCQSIPAIENVSVLPQVEAVHNVIAYVLDRNACLLPSLFAVHEITKFCGDGLVWPHWKLGRLMSDFIYSFQPTAQMVTTTGRTSLLPVVGHSLATSNVWRLSPTDLKFTLSGLLPYKKELLEPQTSLLRYVLDQPYSRDMVCSMLELNKQVKQRCVLLEEQLVDLVVQAMEKSEHDEASGDETGVSQLFWQHLSSQLIYFVLFQFASFPHMVLSLYDKLKGRNLRKGRDNLMWILLQFISGSIQKNPLADFLPVIKLYDILYLENEVLNAPDYSRSSSTHDMAITCIWIHLNKKAQSDTVRLPRHIPYTLNHHLEFLKQCRNNKNLSINDYRIALLCNAYSTNSEYFGNPMAVLMESIYGNGKTTTNLPGSIVAYQPTQPLPMSMLDSLTVHAKMSLIHNIVTRVIRAASVKSSIALAPGLVETYSRLLVYMEIESLGIKGFISQLLPTVVKSQAWGILHTLLEMFSYRLHHTQPHYRVQLLGHLHSLIAVPQTNQNQLHLRIESTALRLITGLGSSEVQPQLSRVMSEPKGPTFVSQESEELNRALVLTLARAMHVTGSESYSSGWCHDILVAIMQHTPHSWPSHTLACFPQGLADFFQEHPVARDDNNVVKKHIETEYNKWKYIIRLADGTTAANVINGMKIVFSRHGISQEIITDNGPQFSCKQFAEFAKAYHFNHTTTSPHFPQANGKIERTVQTVKALYKKARSSGEDPQLALLAYRTSPLECNGGYSPAQLLMGRNLRTTLPCHQSKLKPSAIDDNEVKSKITRYQSKMRRNFNNRNRVNDRKPLNKDQLVRVWNKTESRYSNEPYRITAHHDTPRSYIIRGETTNRKFRRNEQHLLRIPDTMDAGAPTRTSNPETNQPSSDINNEPPIVRTSSGRVVKRPEYLKDYVT